MNFILNILLHLIIFTGIISMLYYTYLLINSASLKSEKFMRVISLLTGFLIFIGSKAIGLSVPKIIFQSISLTSLFSFSTIIQIIIPSTAGTFSAWFLLKFINNKERKDVAFRFFTILSSFVFMLFIDVYIAAYGEPSQGINPNLLPNLIFVISLLLYTILKYDQSTDLKNSSNDEKNESWRNLV